jgi:hypothetical protein
MRMHAHARNQIRRATLVKTSLALAPVLATSKLLGVMENNGETRQKPEAPYQSQSNPVSKQRQLILVRERRSPRWASFHQPVRRSQPFQH